VPVPVRHALLPQGDPMHPATPLPTGTVTFLFTDIEGSTQLWEQHPDAMDAALTRQAETWPEGVPMRVRIALHTGDATVREGDFFGAAVNRCARLRAAAHGG
jgi:class 3 adenylate cyclase